MVNHDWKDPLRPVGVVFLHGVFRRAAGVAVGHAGAVLEGCVGVRGGGGFKLLLEKVDCVVEEVGVSVADGEVQFAFELGAKGGPVALEDSGEVVVVVPVIEDLFVDVAG